MKYLLYTIAIILLLAINVGLFGLFPLYGAVPNLLFLFLLFFSLNKRIYDYFFIAFLAGMFLDFYAATAVGSFIFSFLFLAFVLHEVVEKVAVFEVDWKLQIALMAASLQLLDLLLWLYNFLAFKFGWSVIAVSLRVLEGGFAPQFIYNLILFYPMYLLYENIQNLLQRLASRKYRLSN